MNREYIPDFAPLERDTEPVKKTMAKTCLKATVLLTVATLLGAGSLSASNEKHDDRCFLPGIAQDQAGNRIEGKLLESNICEVVVP